MSKPTSDEIESAIVELYDACNALRPGSSDGHARYERAVYRALDLGKILSESRDAELGQ